MILKESNLKIRPAKTDDAYLLCKWWNDGETMAHAGFPNGLNTNIGSVRQSLEKNSSDFVLLILEIDSIPIGEMSYRNLGNEMAEIGIKICDFKMQGKGYGTQFIKNLINYLFLDLGYKTIVLDTNLENKRAQFVYEKLGFKQVAIRMDSWRDQLGNLQSSIDYELTYEEFMARKQE